MESTIESTKVEVIWAQETESESSLGKYLNKFVVPGYLYIVEQVPDLMASCLYNITKPMLVFSSIAPVGQLLLEAAESETKINLSKPKDIETYTSTQDMIIGKKLGELEKKPIWIDDSEKLMAVNLYARCEKLRMDHDLQVVLLDDYQFLVDDYFQEISDELRLTMLQKLAEKMGIAVIAQKCPIDETQEGNKGNALEPVFHNRWWDDTPKREQNNSLFDYWEA
jgi:hypothetical protein